MQTFLPYPCFAESLAALDYRRLGKQRVEAKQLLNAIQGNSKGWGNHPAAIMWRQYVPALMVYHDLSIHEWTKRGYRNSMPFFYEPGSEVTWDTPWWLGDPDFHASHRSNLLRKYAVHYGQFNWSESPNLEYIWPSEYPPNGS